MLYHDGMIQIREFTMTDCDAAITLWRGTEGIGLSDADSPENLRHYLERNRGLSHVAYEGERLVGAVLCGHDGRRGYLHHMAVAPEYRRRGVGQHLAERCLQALTASGFSRCHLFVHHDNQAALAFWKQTGWFERTDLVMMSRDLQ